MIPATSVSTSSDSPSEPDPSMALHRSCSTTAETMQLTHTEDHEDGRELSSEGTGKMGLLNMSLLQGLQLWHRIPRYADGCRQARPIQRLRLDLNSVVLTLKRLSCSRTHRRFLHLWFECCPSRKSLRRLCQAGRGRTRRHGERVDYS